MPTTSNFGWTTPADTDYVKDGALAIRTLGNGIDTSLVDLKGGTTGQILSKASNTDLDYTWINNDQGDIIAVNVSSPITGGGNSGAVTISIQDGTTAQKGAVQLENSTSSTSTTTAAVPASVKSAYDLANAAIPKSLVDAAGDIIYATANDTVARLAIGTANQQLRVNSGATAPEWFTPTASSSGLTLISRTTFSNTASHIVDNCFTSTYKSYLVVFESVTAATDTDDFQFQWRTGGSSGSTHTSAYYGVTVATDFNPTTTSTVSSNASQLTLHRATTHSMSLFVNKVGDTNQRPQIYGTGNDFYYVETIVCSGVTASSITATGFLVKSSSTNITGAVAVYGLAV
jgi:hypothetical protein